MLQTVLCVDFGTTSLKAALVTAESEVVSFCTISFSQTKPELIGQEWLKALAKAVSELKSAASQVCIKAIAVSGNGPTLVSQNGIVLKWNEGSAPQLENPSIFLPRLLLFKNLFPEEYEKSNLIFSGPEYVIWKLTGKAVTILPEKRFAPAYWTETALKEYGIEGEKLPPFVPLGHNCGSVIPEMALLLGLDGKCEKKVWVIAVGPDFIAGLIGTGTVECGKICDRAGSSEGINFCVAKELYAPGVRTLPSVKAGLWNLSVLIPQSSKLPEEERLQKVTEAINRLKTLAQKNGISFPTEMTVTGGQAKDAAYMGKKAQRLGMKLIIENCADAELLGDAITAYENL